MAGPIFQTDPYDRRVLLVSDKNDGVTYRPIHQEDGNSFQAQDPGIPAMFKDAAGLYRILGNGLLPVAVSGLIIDGTEYEVKSAAIFASTSGDTSVVAAVGGAKIRVVGVTFAVDTTVKVGWKSASTFIIQPMSFKASGGVDSKRSPEGYLFETTVGQALNIHLTGTAEVSGWLNYVEKAP